jgi:hypothetical protein
MGTVPSRMSGIGSESGSGSGSISTLTIDVGRRISGKSRRSIGDVIVGSTGIGIGVNTRTTTTAPAKAPVVVVVSTAMTGMEVEDIIVREISPGIGKIAGDDRAVVGIDDFISMKFGRYEVA